MAPTCGPGPDEKYAFGMRWAGDKRKFEELTREYWELSQRQRDILEEKRLDRDKEDLFYYLHWAEDSGDLSRRVSIIAQQMKMSVSEIEEMFIDIKNQLGKEFVSIQEEIKKYTIGYEKNRPNPKMIRKKFMYSPA